MTRTTFDIIVESMLGGSASLDADRYGPALTGYWPRIRPVSSESMTRWPMWPRTGRGRPCRLARLLPPGHFRSHAPLPGRAKHRTPPNEPMVLGGVRIGARTASTFQFSPCIETRNRRILTLSTPTASRPTGSTRVRAMPSCRSGRSPGVHRRKLRDNPGRRDLGRPRSRFSIPAGRRVQTQAGGSRDATACRLDATPDDRAGERAGGEPHFAATRKAS